MVLSMIYAVGFLILGIVLYLVDLFTTKDSQVEIGPVRTKKALSPHSFILWTSKNTVFSS